MSTHTELGTALRAWRERIGPADVGLPAGGTRRVPGLRREELAVLAGVSVDYLTQLEQGRARNPSPQVLGAFAQTLRLNAVDRELLYRLAGCGRPSVRFGPTRGAARRAAHDRPDERHPTRRLHRHEPGRRVPHRARRRARRRVERMMVSDLRRAADRYPDDRAVIELIDGLRATNPRFADLWTRYETVPIGRSHKTVVHPELGEIVLDCDILTIEHADLHIVLNWAAPDTGAADKLAVLRERVAPATVLYP